MSAKTPEHRAKIAAGVRRSWDGRRRWPTPEERRAGRAAHHAAWQRENAEYLREYARRWRAERRALLGTAGRRRERA